MLRLFTAIIAALCLVPHMSMAQAVTPLPQHVVTEFGVPPKLPAGPLDQTSKAAVAEVLNAAGNQAGWNPEDKSALNALASSKDARIVWTLVDILRFTWRPEFRVAVRDTAKSILGVDLDGPSQRAALIDHMMAWDIPAYPSYLADKRRVFTRYLSGLEKVFVSGDIEWRFVDWGGVKIDARAYDRTDEVCHCIPAIDNPKTSSASDAEWLTDSDVVFGLVINGEARAYPRRIMEVREMVNDTLGGRDITLPYCSLCGAAQGYFTDRLPTGVKRPIMRTSGLLLRSNKVMYDIETHSVFDTFKGTAVTGPLAEQNLQLERATVITTTWGRWREAHPNTTVLVEDLALGRDYKLRETRDAAGPIFPIGDVDPRLPVHEDVIVTFAADGTPVAFPRAMAVAALLAGQNVSFKDIKLELSAGGVVATGSDGADKGSHQAFWFAWSQFHPDTQVWEN